MPDALTSSSAAVRAADTLLRTAGGRTVLLRTPMPTTPDDAAEQLGLTAPTFQNIPLAPVVFRTARSRVTADSPPRWELLVSATAIEAIVGSLAFDSAAILFTQASGILIDDALFAIESFTLSQIFGTPYVYRLLLREPSPPIT